VPWVPQLSRARTSVSRTCIAASSWQARSSRVSYGFGWAPPSSPLPSIHALCGMRRAHSQYPRRNEVRVWLDCFSHCWTGRPPLSSSARVEILMLSPLLCMMQSAVARRFKPLFDRVLVFKAAAETVRCLLLRANRLPFLPVITYSEAHHHTLAP
jgi:hypothetical protein